MSKTVIIANNQDGNGLISVPVKGKGPKRKQKILKLYAGHNKIDVADWEEVRAIPFIKKQIETRVLEEVNVVSVKQVKNPNKVLTLEEFTDAIAHGENGIKPEPNGHFLVKLSDDLDEKIVPLTCRAFRVKASDEDAILAAYGKYVEKVGGKSNEKLEVIDLEAMPTAQSERIIKDCYSKESLDDWENTLKSESLKLLVTKQKEAIKNYKGPKGDNQ